MPTFKHPCPHCAKYINRDVAACPYCGARDPFAPARCPSCRTVIEDRAWVACPKCGQALGAAAEATAGSQDAPGPGEAGGLPTESQVAARQSVPSGSASPPASGGGQSNAAAGGRCTGCGAALPVNARFCTVCGTLAD
jgi:rRNA maturation endonuclease Nob1